ncbi:MAG TPA: hypothetical protein VEJ23_09440, partial [Solirubrobacteraceae bacterium]|nr:hypothetical protein [Solirubrobacteraceae bacterium]
QHLDGWAGDFSGVSGAVALTAPFPGSFAGPWAAGPLSRIRLSRYVVQWDVMSGAGYPGELANLTAWYDQTLSLDLTPELALANYDCSGCTAPASEGEFAQALGAIGASFPAIAVYEAWNEPNLPGSFLIPAGLAAALMNVAYAYCAAHGCTALAGDFSDAASGLAGYEREYEHALSPADPGDWAIHLYRAVKHESLQTLSLFRSQLPHPASDRIWLTELGAFYCEFGDMRGAQAQARNASFLVHTLLPAADPVHAFYYQGAWPFDEHPPCEAGTQDTALFAAAHDGGPLLARPAAAVVLDG